MDQSLRTSTVSVGENVESDRATSVGLGYRQYGNISVNGNGLTIVGDVHNHGISYTLLQPSQHIEKFGLCLGSAPQLDPSQFIGRKAEIDAMIQALQPVTSSTKQRRLILGGMGGVGKTQLTIAYIDRNQHNYDSVFWLKATSQLSLNADLRLLAGRLLPAQRLEATSDEQILAHIHEWLSNQNNTRWLLVFDDHDDPGQLDIAKYCPYTSHGSIIITTRLPDQIQLSSEHIRLQSLTDIEESLDILAKRSGRHETHNDPYARTLAQRMAGLPLALATGGAYLSKRASITFQQYLETYELRWKVDPRRELRLPEYKRTLYTTWDLSFARLECEDPDAAHMLRLLAYFDNQNVWYDLLRAGLADGSPYWLQGILGNCIDFENTLATLVDYCFLEIEAKTHSYSMHNCVHDWTLFGLNDPPNRQLYEHALVCIVSSLDPNEPNSLYNIAYAPLTPHALRLAHPWFWQHRPFHDADWDLFVDALNIIKLLSAQSQRLKATQMCGLVLTTSEQVLGPDHPMTMHIMDYFATLHAMQGSYEISRAMHEQALSAFERDLGPEDHVTMRVAYNLILVYSYGAKLREAEKLYESYFHRGEVLLGPEHEMTVALIRSRGVLYEKQGMFDEAMRTYARALPGFEKVFGFEHLLTIGLLTDLGRLAFIQGELKEAEQLLLRALAGYEKNLGLEHRYTLHAIRQLACVYLGQQRFPEAEEMYLRALSICQKLNGPENHSTCLILRHLDLLYLLAGIDD